MVFRMNSWSQLHISTRKAPRGHHSASLLIIANQMILTGRLIQDVKERMLLSWLGT